MKCFICNKDYKDILGLSTHLAKVHKCNSNDRYLYVHFTALNIEIPKCPICGKNIIYTGRRLLHTCGDVKCKNKYNSFRQIEEYNKHPERREVARTNRLNYLLDSKNYNNTAYGNRSNKKLSYLENWFLNNVVLKYELYKKYDIINEYYINPYFLDFAFENIKLDVEIDGKQHFTNGNKRIQHDINRDNYLLNKGWKIYRISYLNANDDEINKFINFLNTEIFEYNNKYYDDTIKLITNNQINKNKSSKKDKKEQKIVNVLLNLKNSDIDFSKYGWCNKVLKYLENNNIILKGNVQRFIKKHYPNFFDEVKPYIRK